ncbi:DNA repair protein RadA [Photobacterium sanguinicancri]|uniref:DNA repair protein RadA n=1 Tax=Photobacterium sanguinicancri TaxID=875932 RepID=A0AAW7Y4I4_9GAMM|nr:DNA repair protein RadA [Photobacterium sanguinicancri]MDO6497754.1 DNA repair protein RadA [Photobacterium sanguinicancri]MDO6543264.1 DNA repair protein RadA [Photobacterium sanguinicancri]OZS45859.1 DNA repair protein RadA [Photobacterium sanguinicancri]
MAKTKRAYVCSDCGADFPRWQGQCSACAAWNTITEFTIPKTKAAVGAASATNSYAGAATKVQKLSEVKATDVPRYSSGITELDRVLGGGIVPGSVLLLCGDPGAGKSTLLLQSIGAVAEHKSALYVSGEESINQISQRAVRLNTPNLDKINVVAETSVEQILNLVAQQKADFVIIDSIQTMTVAHNDSAAGSPSQVKESAAALTRYAKTEGVTFLIIGHINKDSNVAGPMQLIHIVDGLFALSSTSDEKFRVLRTSKNRFGADSESCFFAMTEQGMKQVKNPSAIFLSRSDKNHAGSTCTTLWEGTRPLLVEIQALCNTSVTENPRRLSVGYDHNRLAMSIAVLARHGGVMLTDMDIFVNCVGGIKIEETSADLAVLLAIFSSFKNAPIPQDVLVFGEIGLNADIRPAANGVERIREAAKQGFTRAIVPKANASRQVSGIEIIAVEDLQEALAAFDRVS